MYSADVNESYDLNLWDTLYSMRAHTYQPTSSQDGPDEFGGCNNVTKTKNYLCNCDFIDANDKVQSANMVNFAIKVHCALDQ
jgi:hypothetical protein